MLFMLHSLPRTFRPQSYVFSLLIPKAILTSTSLVDLEIERSKAGEICLLATNHVPTSRPHKENINK